MLPEIARMGNLLDLFASFAGHGEKSAMVYRTGVRRLVFSYGELYGYALRMNGWLAAHGVDEGDRVLIWGPNSPWWGVAFWGIMARGAVAVPVDFMAGEERARSIAAQTDARLVVQSRYKLEQLTGYATVMMEELEFLLEECAPLLPGPSPAPDVAAELIFTSGTTGNPKGVVLTHRNLIANLVQVNESIPVVTPAFTFLSLLPLSHMFEQMGGFFTPLAHGSTVVYLRTLKPSAILEALGEEDTHIMIAVPRLLQLLKGAIEREVAAKHLSPLFKRLSTVAEGMAPRLRKGVFFAIRRRFGSHFQFFVSGGAPLAPEIFRFWNSLGFTVIEGYGLTECAPVLTTNTLEKQVAGSVGRPIPGVEIRLMGGEVQARGDNIFPGYYRNESATAESFTPDGWFRTGDLGEVDSSGFLRIKGRSKELIVTGGGVNVYPDEIEAELNRIPGVREGCIIGLDRGKGEEVHAVLLLDQSGRRAEEIVKEANERLDPLSRITGFTLWPEAEFPKTTTLKIRKFLVKERIEENREGAGSGGAADLLVSIIARITGTPVATIGEESFLVSDLGLTSIARLELVNYLEQEFRLDLEDSMIGPQTRVADLRRIIEKREHVATREKFRLWTNAYLVRGIRRGFDAFLNYPVLRIFVKLEVSGVRQLTEVKGPLFLISNHVSYLDQPVIMLALPPGIRYRTATAAWAEFFFVNYRNILQKLWKRFAFEYGSFALNLFPLPRSGGFRGALGFMGKLVDNGINILVFPEGERSARGTLLPFQRGLGIMVKELGVPVVPVHVTGLDYVLPRGARWPRRGRVTVTFGEPLRFRTESPEEIVEKARAAVAELGEKRGKSD